jgi:hypothetical protein
MDPSVAQAQANGLFAVSFYFRVVDRQNSIKKLEWRNIAFIISP